MKRMLFIIPLIMISLLIGCQNEDENENSQNQEVVQTKDAEIMGADNVTINLGDEFDPLEGVTARDEVTDLTGDIEVLGNVDTNVPGTYDLSYQVTGTNNSLVQVTRSVIVESQSPIISIKEPNVNLILGENYDLLTGVTVEDDYDTDLQAIIKDDDGFNKDKVGTYIIEYEVTDSDGHTSRSTRTIIVEDAGTVSK